MVNILCTMMNFVCEQVAAARGDADTRFRGLKLLYDIIALFIGDYDDGATSSLSSCCFCLLTLARPMNGFISVNPTDVSHVARPRPGRADQCCQ